MISIIIIIIMIIIISSNSNSVVVITITIIFCAKWLILFIIYLSYLEYIIYYILNLNSFIVSNGSKENLTLTVGNSIIYLWEPNTNFSHIYFAFKLHYQDPHNTIVIKCLHMHHLHLSQTQVSMTMGSMEVY